MDGWTLAAALGIGAVTTLCSAWRWCLVARGLGLRLPLTTAIADYYRSLFLNAVLPGGVLGDVHRAVDHGRDVGAVGTSARAVVLERAAGQAVLIAAAAVVLLTVPTPAVPHTLVAIVVAAIAVLGVVVWALARHRRVAADVRDGLLGRRTWPGVLGTSTAMLVGHLALFAVAIRASGVSGRPAALVPLAFLALLAMGIPLNIGGWGPREGVTAWAFGAAGLGATAGLTVAVSYGLLSFAAGLPGAAVLIVKWIGRMRAEPRDPAFWRAREGAARG
jgi:uncharacterized membrane protein YbhN (UPF0104 family)